MKKLFKKLFKQNKPKKKVYLSNYEGFDSFPPCINTFNKNKHETSKRSNRP